MTDAGRGEGEAPEWLESMTVLDVNPGDLVVFQSHEWLTSEEMHRIHEMWEHVVEERGWTDVEALVVEKMDVGVLHRTEAEPAAWRVRYPDGSQMYFETEPYGPQLPEDASVEPLYNAPKTDDRS